MALRRRFPFGVDFGRRLHGSVRLFGRRLAVPARSEPAAHKPAVVPAGIQSVVCGTDADIPIVYSQYRLAFDTLCRTQNINIAARNRYIAVAADALSSHRMKGQATAADFNAVRAM